MVEWRVKGRATFDPQARLIGSGGNELDNWTGRVPVEIDQLRSDGTISTRRVEMDARSYTLRVAHRVGLPEFLEGTIPLPTDEPPRSRAARFLKWIGLNPLRN
jgi:hypothetical protein